MLSLLTRALEALGVRPRARVGTSEFTRSRSAVHRALWSADLSSNPDERARALARWEDDGGRPDRSEPRK